MSLWKIAWRSIQQRGLASFLTALSMALGVMLVVMVVSIHGLVVTSFDQNRTFGYNMIAGAKGGKLQLTLNTVFYLSSPVENIPYDFYLEFFTKERRVAELANSLRHQTADDLQQLSELQALGAIGNGMPITSLLASGAISRAGQRQVDEERDGKFGLFTKLAIPLCLGDYFGPFRVIGTTPEMFTKLKYGERGDKPFTFAAGRNFQEYNEEHGYYEAVVGATVAREKNVKVGDSFSPTHGDPDGVGHGQKFHIVGVLNHTGTPQDRGVFVNIEGFYLMEDHAKPVEQEKADPSESGDQPVAATTHVGDPTAHGPIRPTPLPVEQREVTAILVLTQSPLVALGLHNAINEGNVAQAVFPVQEVNGLFDVFVKPIQLVLLGLTILICVVSGLSILVSIYNSMNDRKHEIAVMRALGAGRSTVMTVILLESVFLSLGGGLAGWILAHAANVFASGEIEQRTGVRIGFFDVAPGPELVLVPGLLFLAIVVGFLPAFTAYRTDVAKSLGS